jgi:hypothetical protein
VELGRGGKTEETAPTTLCPPVQKVDGFSGRGTFKYESGDIYCGEFRKGLKHGRGTFVFYNGDTYEGQWEDDLYHGEPPETCQPEQICALAVHGSGSISW